MLVQVPSRHTVANNIILLALLSYDYSAWIPVSASSVQLSCDSSCTEQCVWFCYRNNDLPFAEQGAFINALCYTFPLSRLLTPLVVAVSMERCCGLVNRSNWSIHCPLAVLMLILVAI